MFAQRKLLTNEMVSVYESDSSEKIVDARDLHGFLNVGTRFNDWISRQIEKYGFVEGEDFYSFLSKTSERGGRPTTDYILKLDMAKELAMVENNEQGRKIRKYFIEVEKRFRQSNGQVPVESAEFHQIRRLLQMLEMNRRENIFNGTTERALRTQIAETILGHPLQNHKSLELVSTESERWYTTKEIALIAGVTMPLIAKLASGHNLRTDVYSRERRKRSSTGLVQIEYNEAGKNKLVQLAQERLAAGYKVRKRVKRCE